MEIGFYIFCPSAPLELIPDRCVSLKDYSELATKKIRSKIKNHLHQSQSRCQRDINRLARSRVLLHHFNCHCQEFFSRYKFILGYKVPKLHRCCCENTIWFINLKYSRKLQTPLGMIYELNIFHKQTQHFKYHSAKKGNFRQLKCSQHV